MNRNNSLYLFYSSKFFGFGRGIFQYLCFNLGITSEIKVDQLSKMSASRKLRRFFIINEDFFGFEYKKKSIFNIGRLIRLRCYRGVQHKCGYPTRGQRTRSNYNTASKLNRDVTLIVADLTKKVNPIMRKKYLVQLLQKCLFMAIIVYCMKGQM